MSKNTNGTSDRLITATAALTSGSLAAFMTQPLEVIKTEILVNPLRSHVIEGSGPIKSMIVSSQRIWAFEKGGIKNFYRGALIAGFRQSIGFATYISLLQEINHLTQAKFSEWKYLTYSVNAAVAKALAVSLTTPLVVLKTRMEVLTNSKNSVFSTLKQILKTEKVNGLYKGTSSLVSREMVFSFAHYGTYEFLKDTMKVQGTNQIHENIFAAFTAATLANVVSHPFEVIRNRIQVESQLLDSYKRYSNVFEGLIKIYKTEGLRGYIKGIGPRALKKPLNNCVNWVVFDLLSEKKKKNKI